MTFKNKLFLFLIFLSCFFTFSYQNDEFKGVLKIASEPDYPPFCIVNEKGEADGFSVELIREASNVMGYKVDIKVDVWDKIKKELAEGKLDALPLVGRSIEREKVYDFTFPYHTLHGAVFVRKGTKGINNIDDLQTKELLVMKGDNAEEYVLRENISSKIISTDTFPEAFRLLSEGKHDAVVCQKLLGLQLINSEKITNIIPLDIELEAFAQNFSFAVMEGNKELLARLNEGLSIVIADGTYDSLHKKWFSPEVYFFMTFKEKVILVLNILIPFIIVMAFFSIVILRIQVSRKTKALRLEVKKHDEARNEIARQLHEKELILKEVHHRIKNNFISLEELLSLQIDSGENPQAEAVIKTAVSRVNSMRVLYDKLLLADTYEKASVKQYLDDLINEIIAIQSNRIKIDLQKSIDDFELDSRRLFAIGLIVNELLTNSLKYAFERIEKGLIKVELKRNMNNVNMLVEDNGSGYLKNEKKGSGFGLILVSMLCKQLKAEHSFDTENGVKNKIVFDI